MHLRRRLLFALALFFSVLALSVSGYVILGRPQVSFLQALYMAIITLAGVGYGEIVDTSHNPLLRVFNIFVVLIGVTLTVYVFSAVTAFLVEGEITNIFRRRRMEKRIRQLRNHYIVCGLGDTGRHAVGELQKTGSPYVIIEQMDEVIQRFRQHNGEAFNDMLYVVGDATDEDLLDGVGIAHANGLLATLANDKDNLVVTFLARQKNPGVRIVARCVDTKFTERMIKAGANSTVSPNHIGGMRLASELLRPDVVGFLDLMLKEQSQTLRIEEIVIPEDSRWIGRQLGGVNFKGEYNLLPLALKNARQDNSGRSFWVNPPDTLVLKAGVVIILMGDINEIRRARHDATHLKVLAATRG